MNLVTGAMGSLIPKLGVLLKEEYKLQKGVKRDVESLSREMTSMQAALRKVAEVPRDQLDEQVRLWANDVRDLSYHMEDVVDSFLVRVLDVDQPAAAAADLKCFKALVARMANLFRKSKTRRQIATAIKDIKAQVQDVAARRDRYKVDLETSVGGASADASSSSSSGGSGLDPRLSALYSKATDLVGIGEPRDELIKMLLAEDHEENDDDRPREIVSIVGFGGLGKTTLAKAVYDSIKPQFRCTAFIFVSQNPDMTRILKKMLHQLDDHKYAHINEASWDETQLIDELRKFLHNKRYLVVIDDIWKIESWKSIRYALVDNTCGSRIITTTRAFDIANQIGGSYKLNPLTLNNSKTLFYGRIFGSEEKCPEQLAEVSVKILKKCGGIPLAVITIASLLAASGNKMVNPREWERVSESIGFGLGDGPDVKNMRRILSLSYYNLPSYLKTCLLYLSVYPEDHEIHRDDLTWKWIAEGFVQQRNREGSLFEVGQSYFDELMNTGMIQPCIDFKGNVVRCRLHDMVLELMCSLSREENFVSILDHADNAADDMTMITCSQHNVRRLSLKNNGKKDHHQISPLVSSWSISQVRSVTIFEPAVTLMLPLSGFNVLRVLDLTGCHLGETSHLDQLKYVGNLVHLRYLGLAGTAICELPAEIGNLQFLQVLDVRDNPGLEELPLTVYTLRRLACLRLDGRRTQLPDGLDNLTSMEVLKKIRAASLSTVRELRSLASLRELRIIFDDHDVNPELEEAFVESLCDLENLQSLIVRGSFPSIDLLGERWVAPRHLRVFSLFMIGKFSRMPSWIQRNPSLLWDLSEITFGLREVEAEDLRTLGSLPALRILALHSSQQTERLLLIDTHLGFRRLVAFSLYSDSPRQIMFRPGALPSVEAVLFNFGVRTSSEDGNGGFEFGLENLLHVGRVFVGLDRDGVQAGEANRAVAALRHAVEVHANQPSITIDVRPPMELDEVQVVQEVVPPPSEDDDKEQSWEPKKFQGKFQSFRTRNASESNSEI